MVGAGVEPKYVAQDGLAAILVILIGLVFRMAGVYSSLIKTPLSAKERLFCMISFIPKATVQAAIGSVALALGLPCGHIILTVAVLAILITAPLGAFAIDLTFEKLLVQDTRLES